MERPLLVYLLIATTIIVLALFRALLEKQNRCQKLFRLAGHAEVAVIMALLGALIVFGCLQIVLRNFLHRGIIWADPLMRHIVLWLGCAGGAMATTRMRHISIDVLTRVLPTPLHAIRDKVIYLATAVAASVLGMAALKLVIDERAFGDKAFLNVDVWILQSVLPFAFFLISYRSLLNMFLSRKAKPIDWEETEDGNP
ncbi:MAG: TRAP transporter small permease [Candidatus Krumholzibacteria bacterium]